MKSCKDSWCFGGGKTRSSCGNLGRNKNEFSGSVLIDEKV